MVYELKETILRRDFVVALESLSWNNAHRNTIAIDPVGMTIEPIQDDIEIGAEALPSLVQATLPKLQLERPSWPCGRPRRLHTR